MTDTALQGAAEAPAAVDVFQLRPIIRVDKSRSFSTIHGDRTPTDRDAGVVFRQNGLSFDGQGHLMWDHASLAEKGPAADKLRVLVEKLAKKALANKAKEVARKPARDESGVTDDDDVDAKTGGDDDDDDLLPAINLGDWLRGEQEVVWHEVSQEIARRYKKRISRIEDAVIFLVTDPEARIVPKEELRAKFQRFI